jgi:predicted metalloprotease with PDZ domain
MFRRYQHSLKRAWIILLAGCVFALPVVVAARVKHQIEFPPEKQQYLNVRSEFPVFSDVTEVVMPNWTPGAYLIKDFGGNVDSISALSDSGVPLVIEKTSKDRWRIATANTQSLILNYEVFTPTLSVSTSWAGPDFTLINGASVFLYTENSRVLPQYIDVNAEPSRGGVFSALPVSDLTKTLLAENYDELVDNPIVIANASAHRFNSKAQDYVFLNVGENQFWDANKATDDLKAMVEATQSIWKINPFSRPYWFLNFSVGAKGGLEHDYSTVTMSGRSPMLDRAEYVKWLGLMAHEFFHAWNVRRMRPAALQMYDYQNEQYSTQLWLAEGFTSYYDNLILSRAGLISPKEYLDLLATDMHRLLNTPGRTLRPVNEASLEAWTRHYQPNANSLNSTVSYYNKGAIIGFVLDSWLRQHSNGSKSLDDVMRELYQRFSSSGYSPDDFKSVVADVGGSDAVAFVTPLLDSTIDPDVDAALDWYGLELRRGELTVDGITVQREPAGFGVIWVIESSQPVVRSVRADSAGAKAGLLPDDEVLAIGEERLTLNNYERLLANYQPGDTTTLLVSRRGQIKSLDLTLDAALPDQYVIAVQKSISARTLRRLEIFLGQTL